jgi:hypothetical protein
MIEGRFMLAELKHVPKIGVRGGAQIRRTGKPLLGPTATPPCVTTGVTTTDFLGNYTWLSL